MNRMSRRPVLRRGSATAAVLALAASMVLGAPLAGAQDAGSDVRTLTDAEFRWGLNKQSSGPSHGPGLNFLSAGDISGALTGPNQQIAESDWRARAGDVTIEKRSSGGSTSAATWAGTTTDQSGTPLAQSSTGYSGLEMVFTGGEGTVDADAGTARVEWDGTVSALYYSGFVYLTISDPVLTVTPSTAVVTATLGGHRSDRANTDEWSPMPPTEVVLADLSRRDVALEDQKGFAAAPEYLGVRYEARQGETPQNRSGEYWGSFPGEFVNFAAEAGAGSFWYSSGTSDDKKVPLPIAVSWNSDAPAEMPDPVDSGGSDGILGQVLDDTVEDILRAAGTDLADTAAAWMDEAWKPAQPDAVLRSGGGATTAPQVATGDPDQGAVDETFEGYFEEYYTTTSAMTAGTVGAAVASIPASAPVSASGSSSAAPSAPAAAPVSDQTTMPVAANLPLTDVVYAQTSASSETGNPTHQWQWWVGAALLAIAAALVVQTVRRKD